MAIKSATYQFKGMNRDLSNINASNLFAYEIRNMKITANEDNTLLSISTNKGTKKTDIKLKGTPIGHATIDNEWVIFCAGTKGHYEVPNIPEPSYEATVSPELGQLEIRDIQAADLSDYIYKITKENNSYNSNYVCGNLSLDTTHPIETTTFVENEELKKVYWTDSKNQLRFIRLDRINNNNIITSSEVDFIPEVENSNEEVVITKNKDTIGMFPAGTTQYAFSYINYYGQQSNLFHISSIYYNVSTDKALEVNKTSSDSYTIEIKKLNKKDYQYVRIYSIVRTSQDSTPEVRVVTDYKLEGDSLIYTDRHTAGYTIDPTELFYIGGELLVVGTMTLKDNTLFIGDIVLKKEVLPENIVEQFKSTGKVIIDFYVDDNKKITELAGDKYYDNNFTLKEKPSNKVTTFKMGDYYRFGVLLQHKSGRWSEPIYIGDYLNDIKIESKINKDKLSHYHKLISAKATIEQGFSSGIKKLGYIKIRPVIVYPELKDRVTLCQGYVSPTVYNVEERMTNGAWVQSSWFARPFFNLLYNSRSLDLKHLDSTNNYREEDYGSLLEFRHNARVGSEYTRHKELLCTTEDSYENNLDLPNISNTNKGVSFCCSPGDNSYKENRREDFFVDSSIVTMHSPEIEFDTRLHNLDFSKYKFRIIGYVPLTSHLGNIDIITSTGVLGFNDNDDIDLCEGNRGFDILGFSNYRCGNIKNYSNFGSRILCSGTFYKDSINLMHPDLPNGIESFYAHKFKQSGEDLFWDNKLYYYTGELYKYEFSTYDKSIESVLNIHIFPFHCSEDIKPYVNNTGNEEQRKANTLQYKKLSNVRYSAFNKFFEYNDIDINDCKLFNQETNSLLRIKNYNNNTVSYLGNIDKVITSSYTLNGETKNGCPRYYDLLIGALMYNDSNKGCELLITLNDQEYAKVKTGCYRGSTQQSPILMRYKSTPHIVISLKGEERKQVYLPTFKVGNRVVNKTPTGTSDKWKPFWQNDNNYISEMQPAFIADSVPEYSGLWLAELYLDIKDIKSLFGGDSTQAIANNKWNIAGEEVSLDATIITLNYTEGDTYYQRYDNLKTYPWSMEEVNGITDVISFMVETRINLEGRYDSNKADKPHFHILPSNFNLINKAYTLKNNFFEYYGVDYDRIEVNKYPNLISWSKTKTAGEIIDTWLNMNLSSTLDLDGNNGKITSLLNYNGNILAFLDKSLSQILYNELTLISTQAGVPIEIANSGKVTGYRSVSNQVGCSNKWSICQTPNGLYFLDSFNKDLYKLGEGLNNLSNTNGFNSYLRNIPNIEKPWNPQTLDSIKTSYDPINKEVLFSTKEETLSYSELLQSFMSFYDFNVDYFTTLQGDSLILTNKNKNIYEYQKDKHNYYFDSVKPYSIEFISNPDPLNDKIFNSLEFRSDSWYDDTSDNTGNLANFETFNKLYISNEYLNSEINLRYNKYGLSNLKKKFRIWKTLMPRDFTYSSDRIRNIWTKIKLERTPHGNDNCKTVLHDLTVYYSI